MRSLDVVPCNMYKSVVLFPTAGPRDKIENYNIHPVPLPVRAVATGDRAGVGEPGQITPNGVKMKIYRG
jgi:hypothetical protein